MSGMMKVGDLAKATGLTVRTLHHYDEIGLLRPGGRTRAGHRLYGEAEVMRLQQIASLRHLGLSLEEIRDCLDRPEYTLDRVLEMQSERIREEVDRRTQLRDLIEALRRRLRSPDGASIDEVTRTIQVTMSYEKYFSPDQLRQLHARRAVVGDERIRQAQDEWTSLFAAYADAMRRGVDPGSPEVGALLVRHDALVAEFTGGDPDIHASLTEMFRREGADNVIASGGMQAPPGLWDFIRRAREASSSGRRA